MTNPYRQTGVSVPLGAKLTIGAIFLAVVLLLFNPVVFIDAGTRGVLTEFGQVKATLPEGLAFKLPIIQNIIHMNVQTQKYEVPAAAASKDLQDVSTTIAVNYHINPDATGEIYKKLGVGYADKVIAPAVQESLKAATAQFTAEELITKREDARQLVYTKLHERLAHYNIQVEGVSIVNFKFSATFEQAIEAKVSAEQQAMKAKNDLERIKLEAEQKIAAAKGEAESLRIQNEELEKSEKVLQLRWIEKWDGHVPNVVAGNSLGIMLGLPSEIVTGG